MKNYLDRLPKPFLILAPMYDVTDTVFRQVVSELSPPDLFFTEFVNVDGLQSAGRDKIIHRLKFTKNEKPIVAQIWGKNPENYYKTAKELVEMGFGGVDINMGCPDKTVIKNGCCGALINDHELASKIIDAVKDGVSGEIPVSVKTRIGFRDYDEDWIKFLLEQKVAMLTMHLRTVREMSKVPAHWEHMVRISKMRDEISPKTMIIGNGDVETRKQAHDLSKEHSIDGVMIGRGIFSDPFVFSDESAWDTMSRGEKLEIYKKHVQLFSKTWGNQEYPIVTLNKFCKIYVNGFDGAKDIREELMKASNAKELLEQIEQALRNIRIT